MRLTEDKFIINEYSKHPRVIRPVEDIFEPEGLEFGPRHFRMGTLKEIYSKSENCPFCRLVINSLQEQRDGPPRNNPFSDQNVNEFYERDTECYASWQVDARVLK